MFGYPMNQPHVTYWGARAILKNQNIDLLHDRQTYQGDENQPFVEWINNRALPWLRTRVKELYLEGDDPQVITLSEFKYELRASTNASHGYLYIGAIEHQLFEAQPHKNNATGEDEPTVAFADGTTFVVDKGMVPVGTRGTVKVNKIGAGAVIGYFNEKYGDLKLACLLVQCLEPPKWLVDQTMQREAEKLIKQGLLPASPRAKEYVAWAKKWKMPAIPLWCCDFQPS